MQRALNVAVVVVTVGMLGCYRASMYDGDGKLTDGGWQVVEGQRYHLDLGPVDLSIPGRRTYRLTNLPNAEFTIGVQVIEAQPIVLNDKAPAHLADVRLELKTSDGQLVIQEGGALGSWVRSYALGRAESFYYRRGEARDVALATGGTQEQRTNVKAAGGWGTYFTATRSGAYELTFQVSAPETATTRPARLVLHGV